MKALFLGLGGVGQRHLRNFRYLHPEADIIAVRHTTRTFEIGDDLTPRPEIDMLSANRVRVIPDLTAALRENPDVALVANPTALHVMSCLALLEAGIPVFVEKPAAAAPDEFARLRSAAQRPGAPTLMVGYQLRWHPCVERLRALLKEGSIGHIQSVEVAVHSYFPSWHSYEKPTDFYAGRRDLGGGVVLTEIHELDLLGWLFGRPLHVAAVGGTLGNSGVKVEDTYAAVLAMPPSGNGPPIPASVTMSFVQAPPSRRFVVNGSAGRIVMDIPALRLTVIDVIGAVAEVFERTNFDRNFMFRRELEHFLDCVDSGATPMTDIESVEAGQATAFAILASLAQGGATVQP